MRIPVAPPNIWAILKKLLEQDTEKAFRFLSEIGPVDDRNRYLHWDEMRHREPPNGFSHEEWWAGTKMARKNLYRSLSLRDKNGKNFQFALPDCVLRELHWIDQNASGTLQSDSPITNPDSRDSYLIRSLMDEAINSSQLEGASTTRYVAKEMLRENRPPKDRSEQMIYNNFLAMEFIRENKDETLTPEMILELHRILTKNTLEDPEMAGKFRKQEDTIHVVDKTDTEILHVPPISGELPERMKKLCDFANSPEGGSFIHPVIKAIILHFQLAYDHPFIDGNGRTARALFYWFMARQKYWLTEFVSISRIIKQAPGKYGRAYLYTETDDGDLTYFILHQLEVIRKAIDELFAYLKRKSSEIREVEEMISVAGTLRGKLNYRQLEIIKHALKHPNAAYKILGHQKAHKVTYQTARSDLLELSDSLHLLIKEKHGKSFVFIVPEDLLGRIKREKNGGE